MRERSPPVTVETTVRQPWTRAMATLLLLPGRHPLPPLRCVCAFVPRERFFNTNK